MEKPSRLTVFGPHIYWIDPPQELIERADKDGGSNRVIVQSRVSQVSFWFFI